MNIDPIRSGSDYRQALAEIEELMAVQADMPEGDRLDFLVTAVEAWEAEHYALDLPDAV